MSEILKRFEGGVEFAGPAILSGPVTITGALTIEDWVDGTPTELTIDTGAITVTQTNHLIDTEGDAASDDLDTINGLIQGPLYRFGVASGSRTVVFKHATGNIFCPGGEDISLADANDQVLGFFNGSKLVVMSFNTLVAYNGGLGKYEAIELADPGNTTKAIGVTRSSTVRLISAGAETRTLAIPTFLGQRLVLVMDTDGGDCVLTVAQAINQTGNNTVTFNDAGDTIVLVAVKVGGAFRWRVAMNDGATLSTV